MIIECINCNKKFNVDSALISNEGRTIQCGSCNHIWFFKKDNEIEKKVVQKKTYIEPKNEKTKNIAQNQILGKTTSKTRGLKSKNKSKDLIKYKSPTRSSLSKFLSYILVAIITFVAIMILIDTFKTILFDYFPQLELLLFSFYETLKDVELFIKDLF